MKLLKILTILTGATLFNGCGTTLKIVHVPANLDNPCIFELFTESEKDSMDQEVGKKIFRNQSSCKIRQTKNSAIIKKHNALHKAK